MAGYLKTLSVLFLLSLVCLEAQSASPVRALLEENRLEEAMTICRQMEVLSTTDIDNFLACSWACFRYDKEASAERFMEKIRKAGQVGTEYQVLQAFSLIKKKKYVDANAALEKLYQENRTTSFLLPIQELRAELAELEGKSGVAGFIYKQMSAEGPVRARVQWGLARYYLSQGDLSRARTHLEQTAKLWPTHLASRFNLGILSLQTDNLPEATQRLVECYRLNKADPGVLEQLGILFEKKGKLPEAIRYWQKAASLSKDALISREKLNLHVIQVVDALIESRQYDSALEKIETFYKGENKNPLLLLKRGMVYQRTHKYDKALKDLKAYRVANPSDSTAYREIGICYLNTKDIDQAGTYFLQATELEPQNGLNLAWLAYAYEAKGRLAEAAEAWKSALSYLTDQEEIERAQRRLSSIEKKLPANRKKR